MMLQPSSSFLIIHIIFKLSDRSAEAMLYATLLYLPVSLIGLLFRWSSKERFIHYNIFLLLSVATFSNTPLF